MTDINILDEANKIVHGEREIDYGHPFEDFSCTAYLWTTLLRRKYGHCPLLQPEDVGVLMIALKLSRQMNLYKIDNLIDIAGYAETINKVLNEKDRRSDMLVTFSDLDTNKKEKQNENQITDDIKLDRTVSDPNRV